MSWKRSYHSARGEIEITDANPHIRSVAPVQVMGRGFARSTRFPRPLVEASHFVQILNRGRIAYCLP